MFKKIFAVTLSAALAFSVIGCGANNGTVKTDEGEVKLGQYKGLVVYHDDIEVTDEAYDAQVKQILNQNATTELVKEGKVADDSTVNVDYSGEIKQDGKKVKFDGGTASNQNINMSSDAGSYIEGFVAALKGHKVGDKFTEKLKFPDSYPNETQIDGKSVKLAGKDVWFTFTVNGLQKTNTPELTDEFAKTNYGSYGVTDVKSFETYMKDKMRADNIMNKVWNKFVESCEVVSYDKKEEESIINAYMDYMGQSVQSQYGQDMKSYLEACSMSEEQFKEELNKQYGITESVKQKAIIMALAEKEDLIPKADKYKAEAETLAEQMSMSVKELESQYGKDQVEYSLICQAVQDFIVKNVEEKEGSEPTTAPETTVAAETTTSATEETTKK